MSGYCVKIARNDDGEVVSVDAWPDKDTYEVLRDAVGGYIECVDFTWKGHNCSLWLNEEGKLMGLPVSPFATILVSHRLFDGDVIVGNTIITGGVDDLGDTLGLERDTAVSLVNFLTGIPRADIHKAIDEGENR